jgi:hypothetical protein
LAGTHASAMHEAPRHAMHEVLGRFWQAPTQLYLFSLQKNLQNFLDSPSHQIFGHMHEALNIDKK